MSWQTINNILTRAVLDAQFAHTLLTDPLEAILESGLDLTWEERQVLCEAKARDIAELSQILLARFGDGEQCQ
ncbi:MAG TPA: Os1348 family NHLP clan protein [Ktedonobacteraceae bacterium]|jgi:hypothetical protein